ncbi:hypothetical protein RFI_01957 [Reticulomyxa filosa]|uniref:Uncharacterized protein n=1 Tax=Reticulomyxa filosa TaxID=46433 RepID=X6PBR5_RETFI|nr:hypothetical protein RFI_27549 [Reticulomyxa filosa]ETO35117.1 hypothetical protein RFI_01957 [Reticulomyxa filosa]|eukprot:ETO09827.1 hypothetical protein RFI_27549 [Reticulomyxa filosa]
MKNTFNKKDKLNIYTYNVLQAYNVHKDSQFAQSCSYEYYIVRYCKHYITDASLELRRQQEEIKLYHKCICLSKKLHTHNLSIAYKLYKVNHIVPNGEIFCWKGKLSTISRSCIHANEEKFPHVMTDKHQFINRPQKQNKNSSFNKKSFSTMFRTVFRRNINVITKERCLIKHTLKYAKLHYIEKKERVIILSYCKFVIESIKNNNNSVIYEIKSKFVKTSYVTL